MVRVAAAFVLLLTFAGCASVSDEDCVAGDWYEIGVEDGVDGRDADFIDNHRRACSTVDVTPDATDWERGRTDGLAIYCTPMRAYLLGRRGIVAKEICDAETQSALVAENRRGLNAHLQLTERRRFGVLQPPVNPGLLRLPLPVLDLGGGRTEFTVLFEEIRGLRLTSLLIL